MTKEIGIAIVMALPIIIGLIIWSIIL